MVTISAFEMQVDEHHRQIERVNRLGWLLDSARGSQPLRVSKRATAMMRLIARPRAIATLLVVLLRTGSGELPC